MDKGEEEEEEEADRLIKSMQSAMASGAQALRVQCAEKAKPRGLQGGLLFFHLVKAMRAWRQETLVRLSRRSNAEIRERRKWRWNFLRKMKLGLAAGEWQGLGVPSEELSDPWAIRELFLANMAKAEAAHREGLFFWGGWRGLLLME